MSEEQLQPNTLGSENTENQTNQPGDVNTTITPTAPQASTVNEMVSVPKSTLMGILTRLDKYDEMFRDAGAAPDQKQRKLTPKNKTARVKYLDDKLVVGYGKSWEETNKFGNYVLKLEVFTEGVTEPTVVDHNQFRLNAREENAEIIRMESEDVETIVGTTTRKKINWGQYSTEDTGQEVELVVTTKVLTFHLKLSDGREITLPESALN